MIFVINNQKDLQSKNKSGTLGTIMLIEARKKRRTSGRRAMTCLEEPSPNWNFRHGVLVGLS